MAQMMGVSEPDRARHSPSVLVGDPSQCREEIARRVEELGVSYFVLRFTDLVTLRSFAESVIARL